jgi:hypothetical protein
MKKNIFVLFVFILTSSLLAQLDLPRLSQKSTISQNFGYTTVSLEYHRPNVKGRTIWGDLVPFDKVWRTGANDATTIEFSTDVSINGNKIPSGKYTFFTIPTKADWTVILNRVNKQWGAFSYDEKQDLIRFTVKTEPINFIESLLFWYSDLTINSVVINFGWEKIHFSFKVETDIMTMAYEKMKTAMANAKPDQWTIYSGSANFAVENNQFLDEALIWADKSIEMGGNFFAHFVKAKILFKNGNYKEALESISKTREKGKNDKNFPNYTAEIDKFELQIKSKL